MSTPARLRQVRLAGPFQQLVMLAVIRIGPDCHGGAVHRYIEDRTGRWISLKAVYTTLQRLERRGYVRSWLRAPMRGWFRSDRNRPGPRRPRAARRLYTAATPGIRAVRLTCGATDAMRPGLPGLGREQELYSARERTRSPRPYAFRHPRYKALFGNWARSDPRWKTVRMWDYQPPPESDAAPAAAPGAAPDTTPGAASSAAPPQMPPPRAAKPSSTPSVGSGYRARRMQRPFIAVLLPVRHARRTLPLALADVLGQRDVELAVIAVVDRGAADDGSADELARQARADSRLVVIEGPGRGAGPALDLGLAAARRLGAPLLSHMEADDRCPVDRLARLHAGLQQRSELCAVTSRASQFGARTPGMRRYLDWQNALLSHAAMARERFVEIPALHQTGLYRTDAVAAVGGYTPRGPWPPDIDFWLRWFEHDATVAPLPTVKLRRVLYRWRQHARQSTRSRGPDDQQGPHALDALRAAKAHYLARWLRSAPKSGGRRVRRDRRGAAPPIALLSTGRTLEAWSGALRAAGVDVQAARAWHPGEPPPDAAHAAPIVVAAYGMATVRERLRAAVPARRDGVDLIFVA